MGKNKQVKSDFPKLHKVPHQSGLYERRNRKFVEFNDRIARAWYDCDFSEIRNGHLLRLIPGERFARSSFIKKTKKEDQYVRKYSACFCTIARRVSCSVRIPRAFVLFGWTYWRRRNGYRNESVGIAYGIDGCLQSHYGKGGRPDPKNWSDWYSHRRSEKSDATRKISRQLLSITSRIYIKQQHKKEISSCGLWWKADVRLTIRSYGAEMKTEVVIESWNVIWQAGVLRWIPW